MHLIVTTMRRVLSLLIVLIVVAVPALAQESRPEEEQPRAIFESRVDIGGFIPLDNDEFYGWLLKTDFGARIKERVYVGGEVTILCNTFQPFVRYSMADLYFVVAPNVKYYPRCKSRCLTPYAEVSLGANVNTRNEWGVCMTIGGGLDIKRFNISLGYRLLTSDDFRVYRNGSDVISTLYLQFGVRFGK